MITDRKDVLVSEYSRKAARGRIRHHSEYSDQCHSDDVAEYVAGVLDDSIVAGRLVRLACERFVQDLQYAESRGFYFDVQVATDACDFFGCCRHSKGRWASEPFVLSPWQKFIIWNLDGWRRSSDHTRRFRKAYISVGRKNGKSTFCAALGLKSFAADYPLEAGAEVYVGATKFEQACIIHGEAERMVRQSPSLQRLVTIHKHNLSILSNHSVFRPTGSDKPYDGLNPHVVIKDELHAWNEFHRPYHETMSTGGASRTQPLEVIVTTAGSNRSTIWMEEDHYARRILEAALGDNIVNDYVFAFVATIDKDDDPLDESVWPKANPNIDISVSRQYLREQAAEARLKESARNQFIRYHANSQVSELSSVTTPEAWRACIAPTPDEMSDNVHGAFDLGRSNDFAAWAVCIPSEIGTDDNGMPVCRYDFIGKTYTCAERPEKLKTAEMQRWIDAGHLIEHPGNAVDFNQFQRDLLEATERYDVKTWAFDPWCAKQMGQALVEELGEDRVFQFTQTARHYTEPLRVLEMLIASERLGHVDDPCLHWQACNLTAKATAEGHRMPDKSSREYKIDLMVALLMALSECLYAERDNTPAFAAGDTVLL